MCGGGKRWSTDSAAKRVALMSERDWRVEGAPLSSHALTLSIPISIFIVFVSILSNDLKQVYTAVIRDQF